MFTGAKYPKASVTLLVAALIAFAGNQAVHAQSQNASAKSATETYIIDSKGSTLYRNGVAVCRINCDSRVTTGLPRPLASDDLVPTSPTIPTNRVVSNDRYPLRPEELERRAAPKPPVSSQSYPRYPVNRFAPAAASTTQPVGTAPRPSAPIIAPVGRPASTPVTTQIKPVPAASMAAGAQPVRDTGPAGSTGRFTKEEKAIILNAGAVAGITAYGLVFWDYFQTAPKADQEGWFGRTTSHGGADKLGHVWATYAGGHLFSYLYRWWDFDDDTANALGAASSLGVQTLMEVGDAFSGGFGFSYEDALMNVAGAGAAYVLGRYPSLARKIDFRFEYTPKSFSEITDDVFTNYDNQRYLVALKLDGFDIFQDSYLSYLELHAGYYARGYEEYDPGEQDDRRRYFYFGAGFNVSKLVRQFVDVGLFDYIQVPYTSVGVRKGLD